MIRTNQVLKIVILIFTLLSEALLNQGHTEIKTKIFIETVPGDVKISKIVSGRSKHIGYSPLTINETFHSEKSILKFKLSACGYQDSIISITPQVVHLKVVLNQKKVVIIANSDRDLPDETEDENVVNVVDSFLKWYCYQYKMSPLNYLNIVGYERRENDVWLRYVFEASPQDISIRLTREESLLTNTWNEYFQKVIEEYKPRLLLKQGNLHFIFSVLVGKNYLKIKHAPGVNINHIWKERITHASTYTLIHRYVETETERRFTSNLIQSKEYHELLYNINFKIKNNSNIGVPSLIGNALIQYKNGKLRDMYFSNKEILQYSFFRTAGIIGE